jgi:hypothetical protein
MERSSTPEPPPQGPKQVETSSTDAQQHARSSTFDEKMLEWKMKQEGTHNPTFTMEEITQTWNSKQIEEHTKFFGRTFPEIIWD